MSNYAPCNRIPITDIMITASEFCHETELSYCEILVYISQAQIIAQIIPVDIKYLYSANIYICQSIISSDVLPLPTNTTKRLAVC